MQDYNSIDDQDFKKILYKAVRHAGNLSKLSVKIKVARSTIWQWVCSDKKPTLASKIKVIDYLREVEASNQAMS